MPFRQVADLRLFQFESLDSLQHAIFTRQGGVSPEPWRSLNFGATVGDQLDRVRTNKRRAFEAMSRPMDSSFDVWQVHSAEVVHANRPRGSSEPLKADGIVSNAPELTLVMRFADCVPLLLYDPVTQSVGLAHAGWLGTVRKIAERLVGSMQQRFGANPADMLAGIGPSIGPDHYPVGPEVVEQAQAAWGPEAERHLEAINGATHFDLWSANRAQLQGCGVRSIELSGICTACHLDDWYSHRGEAGRTGRFGAIVSLDR